MVTPYRQYQLDLLTSIVRAFAQRGEPVSMEQLVGETHFSSRLVRRLIAILVKAGQVQVSAAGRGARRTFLSTSDIAAAASGAGDISRPLPQESTPMPASLPPSPAPTKDSFDAAKLDRMVISLPLQQLMGQWDEAIRKGAELPGDPRLTHISEQTRTVGDRFSVIIDLNVEHRGGVARARQRVLDLLLLLETTAITTDLSGSALGKAAPPLLRETGGQYVIAQLRSQQIRDLVDLDRRTGRKQATPKAEPAPIQAHGLHQSPRPAIHRIWPDSVVRRQSAYNSMPTIKADAARNSFGCSGRGIVWAVVDSGIDATHQHFSKYRTLDELPPGIEHIDLVGPENPKPLEDVFGHGTHVAGIIAGALTAQADIHPTAVIYERDSSAERKSGGLPLEEISGVAPQCKLVSYKVLDDKGKGGVSQIMVALEAIQRANGYGKAIRIHGVNMSLGYPYDPQWFACGQSPLCEVVDRLARTGVCVVVAAGNSGYGYMDTLVAGTWAQGMPMSINDPGNAEWAITVGSTHRDAPHTFGVSYFSSKGPTGDGRSKPDLVAPGEKIVSCVSSAAVPALAAEAGLAAGTVEHTLYKEDSGTSMATPHVSGAIAALLSVRREFFS